MCANILRGDVCASHTPGKKLWDQAVRSQAASPSCHCSGENELTCVCETDIQFVRVFLNKSCCLINGVFVATCNSNKVVT